MLTVDQINFYHEHGYLHLQQVFTAEHTQAMRDDLNWMIQSWSENSSGWSGPWRKKYMDEKTEKKSKLVHMHDLHHYAQSWSKGVTDQSLCQSISQLIDGPVELHHSTMHVKPPQTGHPFPMHQDWWFYQHADNRFIDALFHLDDTCHANGEIRFVDGSHKQGIVEHVIEADGKSCTPHLPVDHWPLENTVAVAAKAGDVVLFNIHTIHGSHINTTDDDRRMVRVGYRHPHNEQLAGQNCGRPGLMVWGRRDRLADQSLLSNFGPSDAPTPSRDWRELVQSQVTHI
ncbi:MAG TPA: phytanoyl-CoA dioxygenase [Phycisphaerales bacterium]|nr:phytanoyl-CoA dioxygenase [Phycisphaerales bacterium]|tara:strand:- start:1822 stop:2679 length:858 start_codon:yes stop_codon:yes gene_type:complete